MKCTPDFVLNLGSHLVRDICILFLLGVKIVHAMSKTHRDLAHSFAFNFIESQNSLDWKVP